MLLRLATLACLALASAAPASAQTSDYTPAQLARVNPIVEVARSVGPAVVNIFQEVVQEVELPWPYNRLWGRQTRRNTSLGSGVIIDEDGFVLTNAHVIQPNGEIRVQLRDGSSYVAGLINIDTANDVALLKIDGDRPLPTARIGTSSDVMVGETVIAIGNPLGNENTVTSGIVSSVYRDVRIPGTNAQPSFKDFIQLDAPINPGNSGGPLLNVLGEVIGINWAIATEAEGIGFAIPIDRVRDSLVSKLLNPREANAVVTGLEVSSDESGRDVRLAAIQADGPAADSGLRAGDRLLSVAGEPVEWIFDFNKALYGRRPGDSLPLVVQRDDRQVPAEIVLGGEVSLREVILSRLGLRVVDHPRYFGVVVEALDPTSPAALVGIRSGDLIDSLDGQGVNDTEALYEALEGVRPGQQVTLHLFRNGTPLRASIELR